MRRQQTHADIMADIESAQFIIGMRTHNATTHEQLSRAIAVLDKHYNHLTPHYRDWYYRWRVTYMEGL